jgi:GTPase SAR1 family protein
VNVDGEDVAIELYDDAPDGDHWGNPFGDYRMRNDQGFLLMFDITSQRTFDELKTNTLQTLLRQRKLVDTSGIPGSLLPLLVVGNKLDVDGAGSRTVSTEEASVWANEIGAEYLEITCRNREEVVAALVRLLKCSRRLNMDRIYANTKYPKYEGYRSSQRNSTCSFM